MSFVLRATSFLVCDSIVNCPVHLVSRSPVVINGLLLGIQKAPTTVLGNLRLRLDLIGIATCMVCTHCMHTISCSGSCYWRLLPNIRTRPGLRRRESLCGQNQLASQSLSKLDAFVLED